MDGERFLSVAGAGMSEVEGYDTPQEAAAAGADAEHETTGEPFDAEAHAQESEAHDLFLQRYQPVITRLPQALADERAEQTAAEEAQLAAEAEAVEAREEAEAQRLAAIDATRADEAEYREAHYPGT